jgi:hypothetical protein
MRATQPMLTLVNDAEPAARRHRRVSAVPTETF